MGLAALRGTELSITAREEAGEIGSRAEREYRKNDAVEIVLF